MIYIVDNRKKNTKLTSFQKNDIYDNMNIEIKAKKEI